MAAQSSVLAWEIPRTDEPGGLQSLGSQRVRHSRARICRSYERARFLCSEVPQRSHSLQPTRVFSRDPTVLAPISDSQPPEL